MLLLNEKDIKSFHLYHQQIRNTDFLLNHVYILKKSIYFDIYRYILKHVNKMN